MDMQTYELIDSGRDKLLAVYNVLARTSYYDAGGFDGDEERDRFLADVILQICDDLATVKQTIMTEIHSADDAEPDEE